MTPEEKTEYIVGKAMEIIMNSGDARNFAAQAFDKIVDGDDEEPNEEGLRFQRRRFRRII